MGIPNLAIAADPASENIENRLGWHGLQWRYFVRIVSVAVNLSSTTF